MLPYIAAPWILLPIFKETELSVFVPTFLDVKNLGALACAMLPTTILGFGWFWIIPSSLSDVGLRCGETWNLGTDCAHKVECVSMYTVSFSWLLTKKLDLVLMCFRFLLQILRPYWCIYIYTYPLISRLAKGVELDLTTNGPQWDSTTNGIHPLANKHSYWKLPFIVKLPIKNCDCSIVMLVYQRATITWNSSRSIKNHPSHHGFQMFQDRNCPRTWTIWDIWLGQRVHSNQLA